MTAKKISELVAKTPVSTDLIPVADPTTGIAGKSTVQQVVTAGIGTVAVTNGGTGTSNGSITGTGALAFTAGGTNQNVTISPSGTGSVTIDNVPIGDGASGTKFNIGIGGGNFVNHVSGNGSVAIGYVTLNKLTTGIANTGVGAGSGIELTTGQYNSACGYYALSGLTTGTQNLGAGAYAGQNLTSGNYNTLLGGFSLSHNITGSANVGIGQNSAVFQSDGSTTLTSATNCVYIGAYCRGFDNSDSNSIVIGYQAIGKGANTTILGNSSTTQTWLGGGELRLPGSSSGYVGLKGAAAAGGTTYTLPSADGTSGQVLSTNGKGVLSWISI